MVDYVGDSEDLELDRLFSALSDPTRRAMLRRLTHGSAAVGEMGAAFPISKQAVSRHVQVLEQAGLIERRKEGRVHRCHLVTRPLTRVEAWIQEQRRAWNLTLDGLERHLGRLGWKNDSS